MPAAARAEAVACAGLRLPAFLSAVHVLLRRRAVAGAAQRIVAIYILCARPDIARVGAAVLDTLQTLARAPAQILAGAVLQGLLRLRARCRHIAPPVSVALSATHIRGRVPVERGVAVPSGRVAVYVEAPVHVHVVVPVDVDIDAVIVPVDVAPQRARDRNSRAERKARGESARDRIAWRRWYIHGRIRWIGPRTVDHSRVIRRHVQDLRIGRHDLDRALLDDNLLLLGGLQIARLLRLLAQPLHGVHHVVRLRKKRIAQLRDPVWLRGHCGKHLGEGHQ